jgi:hypothetical protein
MSKLTLQALALTGILAVSGLPAFAADITPASPAPPAVNGSVSTGTSAQVKTGTTDKAKMSAEKKTDKVKKTATDSKDKANVVHQQTAQKPAASVGVNGAAGVTTPAPAVNGSVGASVH